MISISYHASHEQFTPSDLLAYVKLAERCGFNACHSSDHFHPWSKNQGQSGYALSWLGAAMEATKIPFSIITTPGQRYHPAITAQAIATLAQMYPNRLAVSLGSGEALNECITGEGWPEKSLRNARLLECATVIRHLLAGDEVNHAGLVNVHAAQLYTLPLIIPPLMCAALTQETARWAGKWADGLLTTYQPKGELEKIINAFRAGGGVNKPIHVKFTFSYARHEQTAKDEAFHQWRANCLDAKKLAEVQSVKQFDDLSKDVSLEKVMSTIPVSSEPQLFIELIQEIIALGSNHIVCHNVGRNQQEFINDFGSYVIPAL